MQSGSGRVIRCDCSHLVSGELLSLPKTAYNIQTLKKNREFFRFEKLSIIELSSSGKLAVLPLVPLTTEETLTRDRACLVIDTSVQKYINT